MPFVFVEEPRPTVDKSVVVFVVSDAHDRYANIEVALLYDASRFLGATSEDRNELLRVFTANKGEIRKVLQRILDDPMGQMPHEKVTLTRSMFTDEDRDENEADPN